MRFARKTGGFRIYSVFCLVPDNQNIPYRILPIIRYRNKPIISFSVVIKGPVARAGSIFTLSRNKGINVPNREAKIITENKAILTVSVSANSGLVK